VNGTASLIVGSTETDDAITMAFILSTPLIMFYHHRRHFLNHHRHILGLDARACPVCTEVSFGQSIYIGLPTFPFSVNINLKLS
jgi:hypothetical protein